MLRKTGHFTCHEHKGFASGVVGTIYHWAPHQPPRKHAALITEPDSANTWSPLIQCIDSVDSNPNARRSPLPHF